MNLLSRPAVVSAHLSELRSPAPRVGARVPGLAAGDPRGPDGGHDDGSEQCVLVPYNDSREARAALELIADLDRASRLRAWVVYVRPWFTERGRNRFTVETKQEARRCADRGVARLRARGVPASGYSRDARREALGAAIVAEARRLEVGRILLGTSGRSRLASMVLGSVTRQVARSEHGAVEVVTLTAPARLPAVDAASRRGR